MSKITKRERTVRFYKQMEQIGVGFVHADQLRKIELTLRRWAEQECGNGNEFGSWAIERDEETGKPYRVHHVYPRNGSDTKTYRTAIPDREKGALKRLAKILQSYPNLVPYHQTDPRGCALWLLTKEQLNSDNIESVYTRGVAVCVD